MKTDLLFLQNSSLFKSIEAKHFEKLCACLSAKERRFERDTFVFRAGEDIHFVYYIVSGSIHIIDEDFLGNRSIIETMQADTLFGEAYVFSSMQHYLVSVIAAENAVILELDPEKLFETCSNGCQCHTQLARNALYIVSEKVVRLTEKLGHVTQRTTREKLLSYLSVCAHREKDMSFTIPYTRQQLADYLCVDRSALSHELSRMKQQGILRYHKNYFELVGTP